MNTLLALIVITLTAAVPAEPTLKWRSGNRYTACNPLYDAVLAKIDCGADYDPVNQRLSPRTCEELLINVKGGLPPMCLLTKWQVVK